MKYLKDLHSKDQTSFGNYCSLQKQTLEPSTLVGIVTDANHPEISCEDNKPSPQHKLGDLQCSNEPKPEFKDGDFLMFLMCLPDAKHPNLKGKVTVVQAS